jgi:hypothetical protein
MKPRTTIAQIAKMIAGSWPRASGLSQEALNQKDRRQPAFTRSPRIWQSAHKKTLLLRLRFNPTPSEGEFIVQRVPPKRMAASHEPPGRRVHQANRG